MPPIPDLVRLTRLDTQFSPRDSPTRYTQHKCQGSKPGRRHNQEAERWQRTKALGRGSYGAVYLEKCIHGKKTGGVRAVKKIRKPLDTNYYRELEALAFFSYPKYEHYFVQSLGWYEDRSNIFIAMEYIQHGDLQQYLDAPLPQEEAKHITYQILEGLDCMHENGFAHRDLKPANIMVVSTGPDWWIKIADFGLSKRALEDFTQLRTVAGTPAFAAPEVLGYGPLTDADDTSYTTAVDVWSIGVIAFSMVTGQIPFKEQRQLGQYAQGLGVVPFDRLTTEQIDDDGRELIKTLMAPDPKLRPGAASCLKDPWFASLAAETAHGMQTMTSEAAPASVASEMGKGNTNGSLATGGTYEYWPHSQEYSARWTTDEQNSTMSSEWSEETAGKKDSGLSGIVELPSAPMASSPAPENPFESEDDRTEDQSGAIPLDDEHYMSAEESHESLALARVEAPPLTQRVDTTAEEKLPELPLLSEPQMHVGLQTPEASDTVATSSETIGPRNEPPRPLPVRQRLVKWLGKSRAIGSAPDDQRDFAPTHQNKAGTNSSNNDKPEVDNRRAATTSKQHKVDSAQPMANFSEKERPQTDNTVHQAGTSLSQGWRSGRQTLQLLQRRRNTKNWYVQLSPDGRNLFIQSRLSDVTSGSEAQVWDTTTGTLIQSFRYTHKVTTAVFSSDGQLLVLFSTQRLLLWRYKSGSKARSVINIQDKILPDPPPQVALTDGRFVAVAGYRYEAEDSPDVLDWISLIWEVKTGTIVKRSRRDLPTVGRVCAMAALSNGSLVVASKFPALTIWNAMTDVDTRITLSRQGMNDLSSIAFSPDGKMLAQMVTVLGYCSLAHWHGETTISVWYVDGGKLLNKWKVPTRRGHSLMALSPDGEMVAYCGKRIVDIWEVSTGRSVRQLEVELHKSGDGMASLAFSKNGDYLYAATEVGNITVLELHSAMPAVRLEEQPSRSPAPSTGNSSSFAPTATSSPLDLLMNMLQPEMQR